MRRLVVGLLMGIAPAWAPRPAAAEPELSAERRQQLAKASEDLALQPAFTQGWFAAAEEVLRFGEAGRKELLPLVDRKLPALERKYYGSFVLAARRLASGRLAEAARKLGRRELDIEVRKLRAEVLDLRSKGDLAKEDLLKAADPAIAKLTDLLLVGPEEVLKADEKLREQRPARLAARKLRDRCAPPDGPDAEAALAAMDELCALLAAPADAYARRTMELNARDEQHLAGEEAAGIRDLNRTRLLLGIAPLRIDVRLCQAARDHARDMETKGFFSHESPVPGKASFGDRARRFGTRASGENIAAGAKTGRAANRMWFHSPGHFKNLLGNHRRVGLGQAGTKWTQMFGG